MKVRLAKHCDLEAILSIYEKARIFMRSIGNLTQWGNTYPSVEIIQTDIENENLFVVVDDLNTIQAVFALILGEDPSYQLIDGAWLSDDTYATLHRVASSGTQKGVFNACVEFAWSVCSNLRIDTHENNKLMRHLIEKHKFVYCGIIIVEDGSPRHAYQKLKL